MSHQWEDHAACKDLDVNLFFPERRDHETAAKARKICAECPVRHECLEDALANPTLDGIRGGMSKKSRHNVRARRAQNTAPEPAPIAPTPTAAPVRVVGRGSDISITRGLPVPTTPQPIRPRDRRDTSPFTGLDTAAAHVDPDAVARIARQRRARGPKKTIAPATRAPREDRLGIDVTAAAKAYRDGATIAELGATLGVSHEAVRRRLIGAGVQMRPPATRSRVSTERLVELRLAGATHQAIADEVGLGIDTIARRLRRAGHSQPLGGRPRISPELRAAIVADRAAGKTLAAIARDRGVSQPTIVRYTRHLSGTDSNRRESA